MALQNPDHYGGLDPSSRALMEKLDELLVDCTPKEVAEDSINGVDYMIGLEELKKVAFSNSPQVQVKCAAWPVPHRPSCAHYNS